MGAYLRVRGGTPATQNALREALRAAPRDSFPNGENPRPTWVLGTFVHHGIQLRMVDKGCLPDVPATYEVVSPRKLAPSKIARIKQDMRGLSGGLTHRDLNQREDAFRCS